MMDADYGKNVWRAVRDTEEKEWLEKQKKIDWKKKHFQLMGKYKKLELKNAELEKRIANMEMFMKDEYDNEVGYKSCVVEY
jgi:hypothetical protein